MRRFDYIAASESGARVTGSIQAADERAAFDQLRRESLRPIKLTAASGQTRTGKVALGPRAVAELAADLAALLLAGASMKNALAVMRDAAGDASSGPAARALSEEISKGVRLEEAFGSVLGSRYPFLPALVAAGEASGSLPRALLMISETIERDLDISEQVGGALSYPAFVLLMTLASLAMIVLLVVPALAPLIEQSGNDTPFVMAGLFAVSRLLTEHPIFWTVSIGVLAGGLLIAWRTGALGAFAQRALLDGPQRTIVRGIVYGGFARALGQLMAARVPAGEAIRLAVGSIRLTEAARRLDGLATAVRGGASISQSLAETPALPRSLSQMARIGEETGSLGQMLERAGQLEQARALRRVKAQTKWLGPALIIVLGVMIGILMSGLLSGVSALGDTAVQ
jgi:general secretion pathway protein F